jgi:hypothetical protein
MRRAAVEAGQGAAAAGDSRAAVGMAVEVAVGPAADLTS